MADDNKELVMVPQVEWYKNPTFWAGAVSAVVAVLILRSYVRDLIDDVSAPSPTEPKGEIDVL